MRVEILLFRIHISSDVVAHYQDVYTPKLQALEESLLKRKEFCFYRVFLANLAAALRLFKSLQRVTSIPQTRIPSKALVSKSNTLAVPGSKTRISQILLFLTLIPKSPVCSTSSLAEAAEHPIHDMRSPPQTPPAPHQARIRPSSEVIAFLWPAADGLAVSAPARDHFAVAAPEPDGSLVTHSRLLSFSLFLLSCACGNLEMVVCGCEHETGGSREVYEDRCLRVDAGGMEAWFCRERGVDYIRLSYSKRKDTGDAVALLLIRLIRLRG